MSDAQWEYCILAGGQINFLDSKAIERKPPESAWQDLGLAGWELVAVTPTYGYVFKRLVKPGRPIDDASRTWPAE
jgi:hypothetical protein